MRSKSDVRASSSECGIAVRNEGLLRDVLQQTKETTRVLDRRMNTKRDSFSGRPFRYVADVSRNSWIRINLLYAAAKRRTIRGSAKTSPVCFNVSGASKSGSKTC